MATSVIAIVASMTELSLGQALINVKDVSDDHVSTVWTLNAARGVALAAVLTLASPLISEFMKEPRLVQVVPALSLSLVFGGLKSPKLSIFEKNSVFTQTIMMAILNSAVVVSVSALLAWLTKSYWSLILGTLAGQITACVASYVIAPMRPVLTVRKFHELRRFSLLLALSELVNALNYQSDQLFLGRQLLSADVGFYTVGGRLAQLPVGEIVGPLTYTLFPAFQMVGAEPERLAPVYKRVQTFVTYISMPVGLLMAIFGRTARPHRYGPQLARGGDRRSGRRGGDCARNTG